MKKFVNYVKSNRVVISMLLFFIVSMIWFWGTQFVWIPGLLFSLFMWMRFSSKTIDIDEIKDFSVFVGIVSIPALVSTICQFWFTEIFGLVLWSWLIWFIVLGLLVWLFVVTYQASVRREDIRNANKEIEREKAERQKEQQEKDRKILEDYWDLSREIFANQDNPDLKKIISFLRKSKFIDISHRSEIPDSLFIKAKLSDLVSNVCLVKKQIIFSSSDMELALSRLSFIASNSFDDKILIAIVDRLIEIKDFNPDLKGHSIIMEMISKDEHLNMLLEYFEQKRQ